MRTFAFWLLAWILSFSASTRLAAEEMFPYDALVGSSGALVRSGPDQVHYSTDRLEPGSKVIIYRHDPGGWCAIRPPQGSFSLVPAVAIRVGPSGEVGEVVSDDVKAWVGTRLDPVDQPMWQVKLRQGEVVEILSRQTIAAAAGRPAETWFQIAPPAGEFRWIQQSHLVREQPPIQLVQHHSDLQTDIAVNNNNNQAREQVSLAPPQPRDGFVARRRDRPASLPEPKRLDTGRPSTQTHTSTASAEHMISSTTRHLSQPGFDVQCREMELALTQVMLQQADTSQLGLLSDQLKQLAAGPLQPAQQQRLQRIEEKIRRLEELNRKSNAVDQLGHTNLARVGPGPLTLQPTPIGTGVKTASYHEPTSISYDGSGYLNRLITDGGQGPTIYALQDETGKVIQSVTPAPGTNLERFLKKRVGVFGRRGYHQKLGLPHVTVDRVVDLQRHEHQVQR